MYNNGCDATIKYIYILCSKFVLDVENKTREVKCLKLFMYITAIQLYPALSVL